MRALKWLLNPALIVVFFLSLSITSAQEETPETPETLGNVDPEEVLALLETLSSGNQPNCAVPLPFLEGELIRIGPVEGGLTTNLNNTTTVRTITTTTTLTTITNNATVTTTTTNNTTNTTNTVVSPTSFGFSPGGNTPVAILVVDSFESDAVDALGIQPYKIFPDVFSMTNDAELETAFNSGGLSHGALVFNHIGTLLEAANYRATPRADSVLWSNGSSKILVQMVDALDWNASVESLNIKGAIESAMANIISTSRITNFVVNESFALLPCAAANADRPDNISHKEYLEEVGDIAQQSGIGNAIERVTSPQGSSDPLLELTEKCDDDDAYNAIFVASSGNSHLSFPFYPASWPKVIGVDASEAPFRDPNGYANDVVIAAGDVNSVPGGWYQLTDAGGINGGFGIVDVFYRGTSFSSPTHAVKLALDLSNGITNQPALRCGTPAD